MKFDKPKGNLITKCNTLAGNEDIFPSCTIIIITACTIIIITYNFYKATLMGRVNNDCNQIVLYYEK